MFVGKRVALAVSVWGIALWLGSCRLRERSSGSAPPSTAAPARTSADASGPQPPRERGVILLGWDGADWELLDDLVAHGRMPNLQRLLAEGRSANLQVFSATISPLVWTTIATGAEPSEHGVLDFFEIEPGTGKAVAVSSASRRVPAYWNIASSRGETVGVVNYWATSPAEEVHGFLLSDRVCPVLTDPDPAELSSAVFPPSQVRGVVGILAANPPPDHSELRRLGDFTQAELDAQRGRMLARVIRNTHVVQQAAETLDDRFGPRSLTVYFPGTDEVAHLFGTDASPRLPCVSSEVFARLSEVVPRYYAWMDELLGRWMERARRSNRVLLLVSDHGFRWGARRSCNPNPVEWNSAASSHRTVGVAAAWGAGVAPGGPRGSVSIFDIAPTVSALLDLPVDSREPGRALTEWFPGIRPVAVRNLWATIPTPRRLPAAPSRRDEYVERLKSLGYLNATDATRTISSRGPSAGGPGWTATGWVNLGEYWNEKGERRRAESAFRQALSLWPGYPPALVNLVGDLLALHRDGEAVATAWKVFERPSEHQAWVIYEIAARLEAQRLFDAEEKLLREAARRLPDAEPVAVSLAGLELNRGRCDDALARVSPFLKQGARPDDLNVAGLALLCLHRDSEGVSLLSRSLSYEPNQPAIRAVLARRDAHTKR